MKKSIAVITAMLLTAAPGAAFSARAYTIPSVPVAGGAASSLSGPGSIGPNAGGVYASPGIDVNPMTFGGLSSTIGATGAANGGVGGTSGGFTGTTGGIAGAPGGLAG
jgi:hypothetical protein